MATGGTGDILTGMMAGLLAPPLPHAPDKAVLAAVWLHGRSGELGARVLGERPLIAVTSRSGTPGLTISSRRRLAETLRGRDSPGPGWSVVDRRAGQLKAIGGRGRLRPGARGPGDAPG